MISSGKNNEVIRICENGRGFQAEIASENKDIKWIVDAFADFYWRKDGKTWGKQFSGLRHNLSMVLRRNRGGRFLVLTEESGKNRRKICIPEGFEASVGGE